MTREGLWILEKNITEVKCRSHHIIAGVHDVQDTSDVTLDHLVKVVCARSPLRRYYLPFPYAVL